MMLGQRIREARDAHGWSQGELAGRCGLSRPTIARIEAGEELVLKIKARASAGGNHIFRAVVECEKPETRLVTEETTRYFETTANAFGDTLQR